MMTTKQEAEWDVFISHASEDKESFVRPLAEALRKHITVWYDEFELKVGNSLRESIDRGLARSRYGIVVLSPKFFEKNWPPRELNGLVSRESGGEKVILPVWHGVTRDDVMRYSPLLADRVAANSQHGLDHVIEELLDAMDLQPGSRDSSQSATQPALTTDRSIYDRLRSMAQEKEKVYIRPLVPPGHDFDQFQIEGIDSERHAAVAYKLSSSHVVYLPISRILEVLYTSPHHPAILQLDGRLQWLTTEKTWMFFPEGPDSDWGVAKRSGLNDHREMGLAGRFQFEGYKVGWANENTVNTVPGADREVIYDSDGRYFRKQDRPYDQILVRTPLRRQS